MTARLAALTIAVAVGLTAPVACVAEASALPAPLARGTAALPSAIAPAPERVALVGDSLVVGTLMYGEPSYLRRAVASSSIRLSPRPSAKVGRTVAQGLRVLARATDLPHLVLVELGTNDWDAGSAQAARWIARVRTIVGPERDVLWVNVRMTRARYAAHRRVNVGLVRGVTADNAAQLAAGSSGRSYVLDWSGFSRARGVSPGRDGMHYDQRGYHVLARFLAGSVALHTPYRAFRYPAPEPPDVPMTPVDP